MKTARRLTESGVSAFRAWIASGAPGDPPHDLLQNPETSGPLHGVVDVEARSFASRYELGEYLALRLAPLGYARIAFDAGLWDWLTLFWFDEIAPRDAAGKRRLREGARYSQDAAGRRWSRHVVRMSWLSVENHGPHARYFLSTPLDRHTDVLEQIAGQQEVFGSRTVVKLGERLYWDAGAGELRKGAGGKSAGSPRRLSRFMKQIRMTYDPETMTADDLLALLPGEFARWTKPPEPPKPPHGPKRGLIRRILGGDRAEGEDAQA